MPCFGELSASRRLEQKDIRGICYTDRADKNAVVVFRGTGGTKEAWRDNVYGAYDSDTRLQEEASDFVRYECGVYDDITVTGHSKGGNLSQYVTIKNPDKVESCVSFDGQGFNDEFINSNCDAISKYASKIKSICAYNDYVNVLLACIAGTVLYVNNNEDGVDAHSSYHLLSSNEFDENGDFVGNKEQSFVAKAIGRMSRAIASIMNITDDTDDFAFCTVLGDAVASLVMAANKDDVAKGLSDAAKEGARALSIKMDTIYGQNDYSAKSLPSSGFYFDPFGVRKSIDQVGQRRLETTSAIMNIKELEERNDYGLTERIYSNIALEKIVDKLNKIDKQLLNIGEVMECAVRRYSTCESFIARQMVSGSS